MTSPRERLLASAREVVTADGLEGLTLRAIARHAGVSHGAPLRHFPSLAALLATLAAEGFTQLMTTIDTTLAIADARAAAQGTAVTPRQRVALSGRAYVRFALADPGVYSVMFRNELIDITTAEYQTQGFAAFGQIVDLVAAAQADGWRSADRTEELAAVVWANVHGIADLAIHGALAGTVGPDAADRVPALSTTLALGLDEPVDHLLDPPSVTTPEGATP
jgi:AcrR family transcriptional regulator